MTIGEQVHYERASKGLTLEELAKGASTTASAISMVERGRRIPSIPLLDRIAGALDTKLEIKLVSHEQHI
jgi:transcriptional regulator with XRE-family HTH domain